MNSKQTEQQTELSWEEAVVKFLQENPDFFLRHPELLSGLRIPHPERGSAVSLIERQVEVLRDRNRSLQQQLQELVEIARENEALGDRIHRFALALSDATTLDDLLDTTYDMLRKEFKLDAVKVLVKSVAPDQDTQRGEFVRTDDKQFAQLLKRVDSTRILCEQRQDPELQDYLFGESSGPIKCTALIALGGTATWGVLAVGSEDANRFRADMGTVYLTRMGEALGSALQRFRG